MSTIQLDSKTMPSKPNSKVDFRDLDLKNQISNRYPSKSEGLMAKRDLKRYYNFISDVLKELNFEFIDAFCIVEAFKSKAVDIGENEELLPIQNELIAAVFLDRLSIGMKEDEKNRLLEKAKNWKPYQIMAISDAVERYWIIYNSQERPDISNILREVCLIR